jgi:hypothetical protein
VKNGAGQRSRNTSGTSAQIDHLGATGNFAAADGKVTKCPVSEKVAAHWRECGHPINADLPTQGGEPDPVFGAKFWLATTRADNRRNDRVIIDIRHVTNSDGGEAAIGTAALECPLLGNLLVLRSLERKFDQSPS